MPTLILDGRKTRESLTPKLIEKMKALSVVPTLAIIQVGERPDSTSYINAKKSFAQKIGVKIIHIKVLETITQKELVEIIEKNNKDDSINGIVLQLPIPESFDRDSAIDSIDPRKDVDYITSTNMNKWSKKEPKSFLPATARGIRDLLGYYQIELFGKKVVVIGRSRLVGKPIAAMCLSENAVVTVLHSQTPDLVNPTRQADVVIVAAGRPKLIQALHLTSKSIVIDVGINTVQGEKLEDEIPEKKLVGDVDFDAVKDIVAAITPVPGGVGPMTVFALFENLVDLCK